MQPTVAFGYLMSLEKILAWQLGDFLGRPYTYKYLYFFILALKVPF